MQCLLLSDVIIGILGLEICKICHFSVELIDHTLSIGKYEKKLTILSHKVYSEFSHSRMESDKMMQQIIDFNLLS